MKRERFADIYLFIIEKVVRNKTFYILPLAWFALFILMDMA
jgi:hypothetical protein